MASRKGKKKDLTGTSGMKLIQHKHCQVCGKAQLVDDPVTCSEECKKTMEENIRKKRMWYIYMAVLFVVLMIIYIGFVMYI